MGISRTLLVFACALAASTAFAQPAGPPAADVQSPLRTAYLAMVQDSLVPADPRTISLAALEVLAPATALPSGFGVDAQRDADWLSAQAGGSAAPWEAINAMARAAAIAHVGFVTPALRRGMRALGSGRPLSTPGFSVHRLIDGRTVVRDVVLGGSAEASGLRVGDMLTRIGDERVARQTTVVMPLIARPAADVVVLQIERDRQPMRIDLRLVDAGQTSVDARLLDDGLGYVRIRWFSQSEDPARDTASLARAAFASLAQQGARGLVLDLRSALGGAGEVAVASALADGDVVYRVQKPMSKPAQPVPRAGTRIWPDRPVVVLVNEQTVSAGEALALSLRELAHCVIVGQTTAGGLTEFSPVRLSSEHALIIPTGVVLGPVSRTDQPGHAVRPDIESPNAGIAELVAGRDPQLQAARAAIEEAVGRRAREPARLR
jgi:C-terminal processing protease CtpA/Prc